MRFSIRALFNRNRASLAQQLLDRGIAAEAAGDVATASRCYQQAIDADPRCAAAYFNLGLLHLAGGHLPESEAAFRRALQLREDFPEAWVALAEVLESLGKDGGALDALDRAIDLRDGFEGALMNAGVLLQKLGRLQEAQARYRRVLETTPDAVAAHNNLGSVLHALERRSEAEACFRRVLALEPGSAVAHSNLANVLRELGRLTEAEASCRQALALDPRLPEAHNHLGNILQALGRASESEARLRRALELRPGYLEAHNSLGNALKDLGRVEEAEASFRRALVLDPADRDARHNLLLLLNYTDKFSRAEVFAEHVDWARRHGPPPEGSRAPHANVRDPARRLRIGYVSPDFRRHSVAYFIEPVFAQHDRGSFEVYCYSNVALPDGMTAHLMRLADHARGIAGVSDADAAQMIRADGIDLLVDLAGHTAGQRLSLFALEPAPVQATYLGYPNTTGSKSIGWRITDVYADPPGDGDAFHSERLLRLPGTFLCFQPPGEAPAVQPAPGARNSFVTFGSFNVLPKVTPNAIRAWAELMQRVPGSRLLLKALGLGDAASRAQTLDRFVLRGIAAERITVLPMETSLQAHLARYHEMDIALDPFPYNGTTTTLEALWMGVPVVALAGDRHCARVGASILSNAGLPELVAASEASYIDLAAGLAGDPARIAELRRTMRTRLAASPLLDRAGFARTLEAGYRGIWEAWCSGGPKGSVSKSG